MSMFVLSFYFLTIFSLLVKFCEVGSILTNDQFNEWKCSRICEKEDVIKSSCVELIARTEVIIKPYPEEKVKELSGCRHQVPVELMKDDQAVKLWKDVGICYLGEETKRCITMGELKDEMLVYTYNGEGCKIMDGVRYRVEIAEKKAEPPNQSSAGILSWLWNY